MRLRALLLGVALVQSAALSGCGEPAAPEALPWEPGEWPEYVAPAPAEVELGKLLFYDPVLGTDGTTACATCHSEHWGMSDGLPQSIGLHGVGAIGPGRDGPNHSRRNSQTLWNSAFRERLFWDGRAASLEEQVLSPLTDGAELGSSPEQVLTALRGIPEYIALFQATFPGETLAFGQVERALAAYQRALVSDRAPYDRYVAGDRGALDEQAVRGMYAFGEEGCVECHRPPRFEFEHYADRGQPHGPAGPDLGRAEVTLDSVDTGKFRVPTLRNLRETEPYFHAGTARTLEDAVRAEVEFERGLRGEGPAEEERVLAIAHFLKKGLTDRTRDQPRPAEVPSGLPVPLDGFRVPR